VKLEKKHRFFFKKKRANKIYYLAGTERLKWNWNIPNVIWVEFPHQIKIPSGMKSILVCFVF
jgi:hypothetical protein